MKFISLFSGIGGFDLGFERAGMTCVAQVERDNHASAVLARHYPTVQRFKDVRDVGRHNLPAADLICGGFPCQDVSVAGNRAGLAGKRSGLWFEFRRIIGELAPRFVVIENVPGLLSSNDGLDFAVILQGLVELRYSVCWRILDAQHFGLAQRRKRVFIVASLGSGAAAEILLESYGGERNSEARDDAGEGIAATVSASAPSRRNGGSRPADGHFITGTLAASGAGTARTGNQRTEAEMLVIDLQQVTNKDNRTRVSAVAGTLSTSSDPVTFAFQRSDAYTDSSVASTLASRDYKSARDLVVEAIDVRNLVSNGDISATLQAKESGGYSLNYQNPIVIRIDNTTGHGSGVLEDGTTHTLGGSSDAIAFDWRASANSSRVQPVRQGQYSGALQASKQDAVMVQSGVRRLTPTECERLQGFDDGWTAGQSDTQRYKQLGNAVAVNVAEWIGRRLFASIQEP